jgi:hypothetical protein
MVEDAVDGNAFTSKHGVLHGALLSDCRFLAKQ